MTIRRTGFTFAALLGGALALPGAALAQSAPPAPQAQGERRLGHTAEDGTASTLVARRDGAQWRVELTSTRTGAANVAENRVVAVFPSSGENDKKLDELLANDSKPEEWKDALEDITGYDIGFGVGGEEQQGDGQGVLPDMERLKTLPQRARDRFREAWEKTFGSWGDEQARDIDCLCLTDGRKLQGQVLDIDEDEVKFRTTGGEELTLARDQVRRIELKRPPGAFLGVTMTDDPTGVRVQGVIDGTAAKKADLRADDVITSVDGQTVRDGAHLRELIGARRAGDKVKLGIRRGGEQKELDVELAARAPDQDDAAPARAGAAARTVNSRCARMRQLRACVRSEHSPWSTHEDSSQALGSDQNCAASVEPFSAVVDEAPPETSWLTRSK